MGCSGSTHMVPANSDIPMKPSIESAINSVPKADLVLKDLPDVVEKVIDSLKETDIKKPLVESVENLSNNIKENTLTAVKNEVQNVSDTTNKCLNQIVSKVAPVDSLTSVLNPTEHEHLEQNNSIKNKSSPTISSDTDSLRTSSPESEIEEALANNNDQNPPTPKPTFSELQSLVVGPVNTILKSSIKTTENFISQDVEKVQTVENSDKTADNNFSTNLRDTTDWEKQADLLALTQKYNPLDTMRKFRRESGGERNGSSLILRNEFKPKIQNIFEDLNEFLPLQSPHRSTLSSAKSERSVKVISSELDDSRQSSKNENEENKNSKTIEIKFKKSPSPVRKTKDSYLIVPTTVRGVPSPSPHKVRERCVVCYNKYKH